MKIEEYKASAKHGKEGWHSWFSDDVYHDIIFHVCKGSVPPFKSFLEIGIGDGSFSQRMAEHFTTVVVDLKREKGGWGLASRQVGLGNWGYSNQRIELHPDGSDKFFEEELSRPDRKFDAIFIDGDHRAEQVIKDFDNSILLLEDNGIIFLHDTSPVGPDWLNDGLCSTAYKVNDHLDENYPELRFVNLPDGAPGLTIVHKRERRHNSFTK